MPRYPTHDQPRRNKNFILIFFIGLIVLLLTVSFAVTSQTSGKRLIPISILALIAGVLFEGKRVSEKWSTVFSLTLVSLILSMLAFLPGKREHHYQFEDHIALWPYWFIIIFSIGSVFTHGDKIKPRLTEGITLLQSIAVVSWVVDYGIFATGGYFAKTLMGVCLLFSLYSAFHAFTYTQLTKRGRLTLSIWSSIIMLLFAIDNIYRVYQNDQIENTADISHGAYIALQFFLLGVSAIYIVGNFLMLMRFLSGKGSFFNAEYFRGLRELTNEHVDRYSHHQVSVGYSLMAAVFATGIFSSNHYYQILPRHLAVWLIFVIFPIFFNIGDNIRDSRCQYYRK